MSLYKNYFGISEDTALPDVEQRGKTPHPAEELRQQLKEGGMLALDGTDSQEEQPLLAPDDKDALIGQELDLRKRALMAMCYEQAETIRQMTELLKEYREWMKNAEGCDIYYGVVPNGSDQRCFTCIKTDLLLKENK